MAVTLKSILEFLDTCCGRVLYEGKFSVFSEVNALYDKVGSISGIDDVSDPGSCGVLVTIKGYTYDAASFLLNDHLYGIAVVVIDQDSQYISDAISVCKKYDVWLISVSSARLALGRLASLFFTQLPKTLVAITGTNGKTSTAFFVYNFWKKIDLSCMYIGTLGIITNIDYFESVLSLLNPNINARIKQLTTPDALTLYTILSAAWRCGIQRVVLEASSQGLHQYRLAGLRICAACVTNITHDHLDYHKNEENYFQSKMILLKQTMQDNGLVVLNADDPWFLNIKQICKNRCLNSMAIGFSSEANLTFASICTSIVCDDFDQSAHEQGQRMRITFNDEYHDIKIPFLGIFQVYNVLMALLLVFQVEEKIAFSHLITLIQDLPSVPGRFECVAQCVNGASVYIDYAHTPDALEKVLKAARDFTSEKLCVVFGCGGDRDQTKRAIMGSLAALLADIIILTDDNPRNEVSTDIMRDIMSNISILDRKKFFQYPNRSLAIEFAIDLLKAQDCLVIAGKGHETSQAFAKNTFPFCDREVVLKHIKRQKTKQKLWSIGEIVSCTNSRYLNDINDPNDEKFVERRERGTDNDTFVSGFSIDTRTIQSGNVFVPLITKKNDGHRYLKNAFDKGAVRAFVAHSRKDFVASLTASEKEKCLLVPDTLQALNDLAKWRRTHNYNYKELSDASNTPKKTYIAITGSVGKTTLKEMLALCLSCVDYTHKSPSSFNNYLGVPLSMAHMPAQARFGVFELGMNHEGELDALSKMLVPDIVIITVIGTAHIGYFKNLDAIAQAKSEIFSGLSVHGVCILNHDDQYFSFLNQIAHEVKPSAQVVSFGLNKPCDSDSIDKSAFLILSKRQDTCLLVRSSIMGQPYDYFLPLDSCEHIILLSLATLACCYVLGVDIYDERYHLSQALLNPHIPDGRGDLAMVHLSSFCLDDEYFVLIDDSYNANPLSMQKALDVLNSDIGIDAQFIDTSNTSNTNTIINRRIAVLGDMHELDDQAEFFHEKILYDIVKKNNIDYVFACGHYMKNVFFRLPHDKRGEFREKAEDLLEPLYNFIRPFDRVLIKGSNGQELWKVAKALKTGNIQ